MDAASILVYAAQSLHQGRTPYIDDVAGSLHVLDSHGRIAALLLVPSWVLQASVFASCVLLLCRSRYGVYLAYAQAPIRLLLLVPSVPFVLLLAGGVSVTTATSALVAMGLLVLVELFKLWTLRGKRSPVAPAGITRREDQKCGA